jgi:hypothetical protein
MVYPYTPFNHSSPYDVITQIILPFDDSAKSPVWPESIVSIRNNAIRDLLFKYSEEEQENYEPGDELYLSKMFVYCAKIIEGFLNECANKYGVNDSKELKSKFINHFLRRLVSIGEYNTHSEYLVTWSVSGGWAINYYGGIYHNALNQEFPNLTNNEIANLYQCALSFYSCELLCYLLNKKIDRGNSIIDWLDRIFPPPSVLKNVNDWRTIDSGSIPQQLPELENILNSATYGLSSNGGRWNGASRISLAYFSAYMTKDKLAWADDGRYITHFSDAELMPEYLTLLSIFPDLESKIRFSGVESNIDRISAILLKNWEKNRFSVYAKVSISNNLNRDWAITSAGFQLIPPPDMPLNSSAATITLNYSVSGFLN